MSRKQLRRRKAAVFVLLMAFVTAIALMVFPQSPGEAQKITDPVPSPVKYVPPAKPDRAPIGPVKRTHAVVSALVQRAGKYIVIDLSKQRLYELTDGRLDREPIKVSTGIGHHATPAGEFRVYRELPGRAWSQKWGGWMYDMLMFNGKIYIHGTSASNYRLLGQPASHGCVRVHQDQARRLIQKYGVGTTVIVKA